MLNKRSLGRSLTWVFSDCCAQGCSCGRPTSSGLQTSYYTSCTSTWDQEWWYISTCTFADGMRKRTLNFFSDTNKDWSNKILKPYPCFLSHSNFSTFFRVTTSMSSTTWNIFTKRLFSRLWSLISVSFPSSPFFYNSTFFVFLPLDWTHPAQVQLEPHVVGGEALNLWPLGQKQWWFSVLLSKKCTVKSKIY